MRMPEIIRAKQMGGELSRKEIDFFVEEYTRSRIGDDQAAALCMAIWFQGMNARETGDLTLAMVNSGDSVDLSAIPGIKVDKHSSGGVADTTTIAVAPLVAACGGVVAKMSGRGLGHSGGTLDKLESIPGYKVYQEMDDFFRIVDACGASVIGQTASLAPADKKLYALRDVTSTVDSMPLIASSIMSKKLAAGSDRILLDVKWGSGAFMPDVTSAKQLARIMVEIGYHGGKPTKALVTDMNQPLGNAVGNALEIMEAVEILRDENHGDLRNLVVLLATEMLVMGEVFGDSPTAEKAVLRALKDGRALEKFQEMIELHGGDPRVCGDFSRLPKARRIVPVPARRSGYVCAMDTAALGTASVLLGAGRERKEDAIDPAVGFWMKVRLGDFVERGDALAEFHVNDRINEEAAERLFVNGIILGDQRPDLGSLVAAVIQR
ncbi:MAG: thymidine phosphorylase [Dethiosulfovibrio peptidovorans]|nr:MAG: thymidine phosphorylase [Dethiosulfovibrio peptidovorans]